MNALSNLWVKLTRSRKYREAFVAAELKRGIPAQIRVLRKQRGWNQATLAERAGLTQGAISRAEDPDYGNLTFNNILRIAGGFDVAFVGRFVPFSELARWQTNLSEESLQAVSFAEDVAPPPTAAICVASAANIEQFALRSSYLSEATTPLEKVFWPSPISQFVYVAPNPKAESAAVELNSDEFANVIASMIPQAGDTYAHRA